MGKVTPFRPRPSGRGRLVGLALAVIVAFVGGYVSGVTGWIGDAREWATAQWQELGSSEPPADAVYGSLKSVEHDGACETRECRDVIAVLAEYRRDVCPGGLMYEGWSTSGRRGAQQLGDALDAWETEWYLRAYEEDMRMERTGSLRGGIRLVEEAEAEAEYLIAKRDEVNAGCESFCRYASGDDDRRCVPFRQANRR